MAAVTLSPGFQVVALKIQEAALMHSDVRSRLQDAVHDAHRGTGNYGYYIDHTGDGESGDVIYCCNGDIRKAPYELGAVGDKATANIGMANSTNVVPRTVYEEEADDDDHYAAMTESFKTGNLYTDLPLYERFISKDERSKASEEDFAGKGKSFPILKRADVQAAIHAMGRAGSSNYGVAQLKKNIIAIAKKKGWEDELPKSWRGDGAKESAKPAANGALKLVESTSWTDTDPTMLKLIESTGGVRMPIKLIAPGKGSSAFYPAEVLKRDGPNVFTKGTHIYINHATTAEESARPEGDWHKLAGALDTNAYWDENGKKGPGLYAEALFTSDYAPLVKEKASFTGMSIRAAGVAESNKKHDGLPVLKQLTHAESVDVVTRAGAGGMILTEAALPQQENHEMTLQEAQTLINAEVAKATAPLHAQLRESKAREEATRILEGVNLPAVSKTRIIERAVAVLPLKDNALDVEKFRELVVAEAKAEGQYVSQLVGSGKVIGLGAAAPAELTESQREEQRKAEKRRLKEAQRFARDEDSVFAELTGLPVREVA